MNSLRFNLNGEWIELADVPPTLTMLRFLRDRKGLAGTKEGCAEGDCGACTVAVVERNADGSAAYRAINSCLLLLPMVQGKHVVTVEALKDVKSGAYHPVQDAMSKALGSQCGYCTPGVVMTLFEATYRKDLTAEWKLEDQLCGNLCRCTGYRPIRDAAKVTAGTCPADRFSTGLEARLPTGMALNYSFEGQTLVTPTSLPELWNAIDEHPTARFVSGGTDLSLEITKKFERIEKLVLLEGLPELKRLKNDASGSFIGSGVTISELEDFSEKPLPPVHRMVRYFGARQIKHRGTVGGSLCTASPIGDLAPVFIALGADALLVSRAGIRRLPLHEFFVSYRKTALQPGEILLGLWVPPLAPTTRALAYKVSKRRELDISTVAAGLLLETNADNVVTTARFAFGGMAATPKRAAAAENAVLNKVWSRETAEAAAREIANDFKPMADHRGSAEYRALVAANLIRGFFAETFDIPQPALKAQHAGTVQTPEELKS